MPPGTCTGGRIQLLREGEGPTVGRAAKDQVAESLVQYYNLGVSTLLIRGFDPLNDAAEYGRELIPLVRAEVARRDRLHAAA